MIITTYNEHVRLLSSEPFGWFAPPKSTRAWEPTLFMESLRSKSHFLDRHRTVRVERSTAPRLLSRAPALSLYKSTVILTTDASTRTIALVECKFCFRH